MALIKIAMDEDGLTGDPRDYAILDGTGTLYTHLKEYQVELKGTDKAVDPRVEDGALDPSRPRTVLHRRKLWEYLGHQVAKRFWYAGRRTRA